MTMLTARRRTDPDRYAEQLLSHLGRRVTWTTDGDASTADPPVGERPSLTARRTAGEEGLRRTVDRRGREYGLPQPTVGWWWP